MSFTGDNVLSQRRAYEQNGDSTEDRTDTFRTLGYYKKIYLLYIYININFRAPDPRIF